MRKLAQGHGGSERNERSPLSFLRHHHGRYQLSSPRTSRNARSDSSYHHPHRSQQATVVPFFVSVTGIDLPRTQPRQHIRPHVHSNNPVRCSFMGSDLRSGREPEPPCDERRAHLVPAVPELPARSATDDSLASAVKGPVEVVLPFAVLGEIRAREVLVASASYARAARTSSIARDARIASVTRNSSSACMGGSSSLGSAERMTSHSRITPNSPDSSIGSETHHAR